MKYWTDLANLEDDLDDEVYDVAVGTLHALLTCDHSPRPQLTRLGVTDSDDDEWRYELEIELAPGVILPVECGLLECEDLGDPDTDTVVHYVMEGVDVCGPRVAVLGDTLHRARIDVRRTLAAWHRSGLQVRLLDVRLAPYDHWRGSQTPCLHVWLETLDDRLEPSIEVVSVERPDAIGESLEDVRPDLLAAYDGRAAMLAMGASGTINQLAVNALASTGDLGAGLRRLSRERRFWLDDHTCILMLNGRVSAGNGDPDAEVHWTGDWMTVPGVLLPAERLAQAVGQPASTLFPHKFLSPDMTVVEATTGYHEGTPLLEIRFVNRVSAFCSAGGRVWDLDANAEAGAGTAVGGEGNVVEFRRRPAA